MNMLDKKTDKFFDLLSKNNLPVEVIRAIMQLVVNDRGIKQQVCIKTVEMDLDKYNLTPEKAKEESDKLFNILKLVLEFMSIKHIDISDIDDELTQQVKDTYLLQEYKGQLIKQVLEAIEHEKALLIAYLCGYITRCNEENNENEQQQDKS